MMPMALRVDSRGRLIVLIALAIGCAIALAPASSMAQGCSMCATYLNGQDSRSDAFKTAIMFLMCMPFVVVGTAGGWIFWMHWRSRARQLAARGLRAEGEGAS